MKKEFDKAAFAAIAAEHGVTPEQMIGILEAFEEAMADKTEEERAEIIAFLRIFKDGTPPQVM